jgi:glutathione S-transferase
MRSLCSSHGDEARSIKAKGGEPAMIKLSIETGELKLFESGAIVLHIAERSQALMPSDANGRARTRAGIFAALNSVEPAIQNLAELDLTRRGAGTWPKG